jgi:uncharacterized NAD(P)/FAD-binding protein YdhS
MFEKGDTAGIGMPYSDTSCSRAMLANIASIEIPPIVESYLDWLRAQSDQRLLQYGIRRDQLHDRLFTPRMLLGEYFRDQLVKLVEEAWGRGHQVELRESTEITDIAPRDAMICVTTAGGDTENYDRVVLATGHDFQTSGPVKRGYFPNPWSGLIDAEIGEVDVGVMGTSLSAIDTVMAVAQQHGRFQRQADGNLSFLTTARVLSITMMSRHGILPEADFYCPIPYEPLQVLTDEFVADFVAAGSEANGGLDRLYEVLVQELTLIDPGYAVSVNLAASSADDFADRYFAERFSQDPFDWARQNLAEVQRNKSNRHTVAWKYAILRTHEVMQSALSGLNDEDRLRFDRGLRRVFIDNYAAVPSESIRRLLALHDAGVLKLTALGDDYDLEIADGQTRVKDCENCQRFDVFIDARGQKPLSSEDLPFPSLRDALLGAGQETPEVDGTYHLTAPSGLAEKVAFGAIPYLMHDKPFVQGITESFEIGTAIARGLLCDVEAPPRQMRRKWA